MKLILKATKSHYLKKGLLLSSYFLCANTLAVVAENTAPATAAPTPTTLPFAAPTVSGPMPLLGVTAMGLTGLGTTGYGDAMIPVAGNATNFFYLDPQALFHNNNQYSGSMGVGKRYLTEKMGILGAYVFADYNHSTNDNSFWFISPGIERLGDKLDFSANAYIPVTSQSINRGTFTGSELGIPGPVFLGHDQIDPLYNINESTGPGGDVSIGYRLPVQNNTKVYVGSYYFTPKNDGETGNIWGGALQLEVPFTDRLNLQLSEAYDNVSHNILKAGLSYDFADRHTAMAYKGDLTERMLDPIRRNLVEGPGSSGTSQPIVESTVATGEFNILMTGISFFAPDGGLGGQMFASVNSPDTPIASPEGDIAITDPETHEIMNDVVNDLITTSDANGEVASTIPADPVNTDVTTDPNTTPLVTTIIDPAPTDTIALPTEIFPPVVTAASVEETNDTSAPPIAPITPTESASDIENQAILNTEAEFAERAQAIRENAAARTDRILANKLLLVAPTGSGTYEDPYVGLSQANISDAESKTNNTFYVTSGNYSVAGGVAVTGDNIYGRTSVGTNHWGQTASGENRPLVVGGATDTILLSGDNSIQDAKFNGVILQSTLTGTQNENITFSDIDMTNIPTGNSAIFFNTNSMTPPSGTLNFLLTNSILHDNDISGFVDDASGSSSAVLNVMVDNTTITNNDFSGMGGTAAGNSNINISLLDSQITNNGQNGVFLNVGGQGYLDLNIQDSTISNTGAGGGGGLLIGHLGSGSNNTSNITIDNSTISNNLTNGFRVAMNSPNGISHTSINNTTFTDNANSSISITNSTTGASAIITGTNIPSISSSSLTQISATAGGVGSSSDITLTGLSSFNSQVQATSTSASISLTGDTGSAVTVTNTTQAVECTPGGTCHF